MIENINTAISTICPVVWNSLNNSSIKKSHEKVWIELASCILSSQVNYEFCKSVVKSLNNQGLLNVPYSKYYKARLRKALNKPILHNGKEIRYRFPNVKAEQLAIARKNLHRHSIDLSVFAEGKDAFLLRDDLVSLIPGLGMKQASMFIRNAYGIYDLAVIDTHILRYMGIARLFKKTKSNLTRSQYLQREQVLCEHSKEFGYPIGCVDHAIWVVMRVASREGYI